MRGKTNLYLIDGKPVLVPDEGVSESYEDLDSDATGRDQSGIMHRSLIREKVGTWGFNYASLTAEEWKYMESLFKGKATFSFTHPAVGDPGSQVKTTAYRSKYSITWRSALTGTYQNYEFNIIEC